MKKIIPKFLDLKNHRSGFLKTISVFIFSILAIGLYGYSTSQAFIAIQEPSEGGGGSGGYVPNGQTIYMKFFAVVCDSESDLPNLNNPHPSFKIGEFKVVERGAPTVTEAYLNSFLSSHPTCRTEDGWTFRYGKGENFPPYTSSPTWPSWITTAPTSGGVAVAQQPTSYLTASPTKWVEDYNYPQQVFGNPPPPYTYEYENGQPYTVTTSIKEPRIYVSMYRGPGTYSQQWKYDQGGYVPDGYQDFSTYNNPPAYVSQNDISSELRCYDNHVGYSNYSYIRSPEGGITYTCIFFTSKQPTPATINVNNNACPAATWAINPGSYTGFSNSVTAGTYSINVPTPSGYKTPVVTTSDSGSTPMTSLSIASGQTKQFTITCEKIDDPVVPPTCVEAGTCPLPACRIDSFNDQWETNGWVYPTWATSYSNNVVLSGGQFGSGVQVEPDGQRAININADVTLTLTAYEGAACVGTVSKSAVMHAESVSMCTVPGKEYLPASDPNCKPDVQVCSFVDPYTGGDGFPDFAETGDGITPIYWYSNAGNLVMSGGPYTNYPVNAPNSNGYFTFPNITSNTQVTLVGNNGQCANTSILYAAAVPPKPAPFTATPQSCGTGEIALSWGQSPGSSNYVVYRNGSQIYSGPEWSGDGTIIKRDKGDAGTGLTPGQTYAYSIIGQSPNGNTQPNTVSATAPAACPTPPTVTLIANPTSVPYNGSSNLSWSTTGSVTSCTASGGWSGTKSSASGNTPYSTGALTANTTYTLTCTGPGGTSAPSSVTVTVGTPPPPPPQGFTVSASSCGNNWLNLSWYPPSSGTVTSYRVYRDGGPAPIFDGPPSSIQLGGGALGFSDTGLVPGSTHSYSVVAVNGSGPSSSVSGSGTVSNNCPSTFDYSISDPGGITIPKGQSGQNGATATLTAGNTQPITFTFSNFPSTIHPSASACFPSSGPTCSSTFTYTVDSNANSQSYYVRVSATPLGVTTVARDFYITVTAPAAMSITCSPSLTTAKIGQAVTWTASVNSGGTPPYTYSWSGTAIPTSPAPTANPYTITYSTIGIKSARATVTDATGATATCPDAVTNITFNPTIIEF